MPWEGTYAGGEVGNNKLECDLLATNPSLREIVIEEMTAATMRHEPDFVVGVPRGANWLAEAIGERTGIQAVYLDYRDSDPQKRMFYRRVKDATLCASLERGVVVDDVFNRFTNTRRALMVEGMQARIVAAEAIIDRGDPDARESLMIPTDARIKHPIPPQITAASSLWKYIQRS